MIAPNRRINCAITVDQSDRRAICRITLPEAAFDSNS